MDYECPRSLSHSHKSGGPRAHMTATLEEQLRNYNENAENEGEEEEEYLEEEVLQVRSEQRASLKARDVVFGSSVLILHSPKEAHMY